MHYLLHDPASVLPQTNLDIDVLLACIADHEEIPDNIYITLSFVDQDTICAFNTTYRKLNKPTDVLSFEQDLAIDDLSWFTEPPHDHIHLGDILIASEIAQQQACDYGISFMDELSLLIVHGILHLVGWDHEYKEEAEEMEAREHAILSHFFNKPFVRSASFK